MHTTKKVITILLASLMLMWVSTLQADNDKADEDTYIDDIPFNTKVIFDSVQSAMHPPTFALYEEEYIDDIPFDTRSIATNALSEKALSTPFRMPDEAYISDIPFNTKAIASRHLKRNFHGVSAGVIRFILLR